MTEWTLYTPAFDGDAPEGVGLDTHEVEYRKVDYGDWTPVPRFWKPWLSFNFYRYRPRMEDVKG